MEVLGEAGTESGACFSPSVCVLTIRLLRRRCLENEAGAGSVASSALPKCASTGSAGMGETERSLAALAGLDAEISDERRELDGLEEDMAEMRRAAKRPDCERLRVT